MDLTQYHSYHFIGIGGMGMRALAGILKAKDSAYPDLIYRIHRRYRNLKTVGPLFISDIKKKM